MLIAIKDHAFNCRIEKCTRGHCRCELWQIGILDSSITREQIQNWRKAKYICGSDPLQTMHLVYAEQSKQIEHQTNKQLIDSNLELTKSTGNRGTCLKVKQNQLKMKRKIKGNRDSRSSIKQQKWTQQNAKDQWQYTDRHIEDNGQSEQNGGRTSIRKCHFIGVTSSVISSLSLSLSLQCSTVAIYTCRK